MPLKYENCEAVILAGGRSERMGTCKALLPKNGETMIQYIYNQLFAFDECCLSANDPALKDCLNIPVVADVYTDCGPLGGIHAVLSHTQKNAVFVVACDLPFFCAEVPKLMLKEFSEESDAMVCMDSSGRVHPLCGIYSRRIIGTLEAYLQEGGRRVIPFLERLNCCFFEIGRYLPESVLYNMNTPEEYCKAQKYSEGNKQPVEEMQRFKSRRNIVTMLQTDIGAVVRKQYQQEVSCIQEQMVYERLHGSSLPHAGILQASPGEITMTYHSGRTLLEILEEQEKTGVICWEVWDKLVQWLIGFHKITRLTMMDVNLRNFLYDDMNQTLYGVDFEECREGNLSITAAQVAAYIQNYAPEKTPIKTETADYVLQQFSKYLNINLNELRGELEIQERILLLRRKNRT